MGTTATFPVQTPGARRPGQHRAATDGGPPPFEGVETFAAGRYPGDKPGEIWTYSPADVRQIIRNFAALSAGEKPIHRIPVVITHDQVYAHGWVSKAYQTRGKLFTDWVDADPQLIADIESGRLRKVSAEIKEDFRHRDGKITPGLYIYRVNVIGADPPRVKGLDDVRLSDAYRAWASERNLLPKHFADPRGRGRRVVRTIRTIRFFAEPRAPQMDRNAAIAFLTDVGVDPANLTDAVPDALLIDIATKWQAEESLAGEPANPTQLSDPNAKPAATPAGNPPPTTGGTPAATPAGTPGNPGNLNPPKKVTMTHHFADPAAMQRTIAELVDQRVTAQTESLRTSIATETAARLTRAREDRRAAVRRFCDTAAEQGRMRAADNDETHPLSERSRLLRIAEADDQAPRKFADPATKREVTATELEMQMREIESRPARRFAERVRGGAAGGSDGQAGAGGADPFREKVRADIKRELEKYPAPAAAGGNGRARR